MLAIEKGFTVEKYSEYFFDNGGQLCSMENSPTISFWINKGKDTNKDYIEYQIDKFYKRQDKKVPRILVVSHEFTLTGAPKVALILSRTLKNIYGVSPVVISLKSGPIKSEFIDENLFVLEMNDFNVNKENFEKYFNKFDCVIFSSWVYPVLGCYNKKIVPPFAWYCHEAFEQEHFIPVYNQIREFVASNDIVLAGSPVTKTGMKMLCPEKQIDLLLYGTNDLSKNKANRKNKPEAIKSKRIFLFPATMEQRKNQCFLAEAIKNLPKDIQDKSHFIFIGRSIFFKEYYQQFKDIVEGLSCVEHIEEVPFDELMEYYDKADCIVVPSTFDPMPMVATYGFMKKKLCLLSDLIGTATLVKNNENAVLFNTKNALELTEKLKDITLNYEDYKQIAEKGREVYENNFSIEIFERKIKKYVDVLLLKNRKRRIKLFLNNIFSVKNIAPHKVFTILGIKLKFKTKKLIRLQNLQVNSFSENIFSVKNNGSHKVVTILGVKIKLKSKKLLKLFNSEQNSFFEDIFSVRNIGFYKVITILGVKIKLKSKKHLRLFNLDQNSWLEDIFSVKNIGIHKVLTILGIKLKFKSKKLIFHLEKMDLQNANYMLNEEINRNEVEECLIRNYPDYLSKYKYVLPLKIIKKIILNPNIKVVSFDIFDTLLYRPCVNPIDIFYLIAERINQKYNIDFIKLRLNAESLLNNKNANIHDIYDFIKDYYHLDKELIEGIKKEEIAAEKQLLQVRDDIKEIYNSKESDN